MEHIRDIMGKPQKIDTEIPLVDQLLPPDHPCEKCNGFGWYYPLIEGKVYYGDLKRCECRIEHDREYREHALTRLCGLPEKAKRMTIETFKDTTVTKVAVEEAKRMIQGARIEKYPRWLILMGDVDRGKTHLALAICQEWLKAGRAAKYVFVPLLLDSLRPNKEYSLDFYLNVPLLVLDDLGTEKATEWSIQQLETIIDYRYINELATIITTNLPLDDPKMSPRIASRMVRYEYASVVVLGGGEYRLRGHK